MHTRGSWQIRPARLAWPGLRALQRYRKLQLAADVRVGALRVCGARRVPLDSVLMGKIMITAQTFSHTVECCLDSDCQAYGLSSMKDQASLCDNLHAQRRQMLRVPWFMKCCLPISSRAVCDGLVLTACRIPSFYSTTGVLPESAVYPK